MPEWLKGADCKSVGAAYAGSNPASPTKTALNPPSPPLYPFWGERLDPLEAYFSTNRFPSQTGVQSDPTRHHAAYASQSQDHCIWLPTARLRLTPGVFPHKPLGSIAPVPNSLESRDNGQWSSNVTEDGLDRHAAGGDFEKEP